MEQLAQVIEKYNKFALLGHISEDADSVGSCLAFKSVLEKLGKDVTFYISAPLQTRLDFLNSDAKVYSNFEEFFDVCLCLDCADIDRLGDRIKIFKSSKITANIDHHITNKGYADINIIKPDASSTGEVLFSVFEKLKITIDKEIAGFLYTAIASDTGSFKYSNVGEDTFNIAAKLLSYNIDNAYISRMLFDTMSEKEGRLKAYLMNKIKLVSGGKISYIKVTKEEFEKFEIDENNANDIVDIARKIRGSEISFSIREKENSIKISLRSNDKDISKVASLFGGGGHKKAAGASVENGDIDLLEKQIITACEEILND